MEQNKAERLNENVTEKMCSPADADTYRDGCVNTEKDYVESLNLSALWEFVVSK